MCDILRQKNGMWAWYEVNASTSVKERHLDGMAFQYVILQQYIKLHSVNIMYLNKEYARNGELDVHRLFIVEEQTNELIERIEKVSDEIALMKVIAQSESIEQDIGPYCSKYGKEERLCEAKPHCWSQVSEYSIFDIARIGKKHGIYMKKGSFRLKTSPRIIN